MPNTYYVVLYLIVFGCLTWREEIKQADSDGKLRDRFKKAYSTIDDVDFLILVSDDGPPVDEETDDPHHSQCQPHLSWSDELFVPRGVSYLHVRVKQR